MSVPELPASTFSEEYVGISDAYLLKKKTPTNTTDTVSLIGVFFLFILVPLGFSVKTGTRFHPLFRLYLAISVEVGTKIAMSAHPATRIISQQRENQYPQRVLLPFGTGVFGLPFAVESALIANADAFLVVLINPIYISCYYNQ